MILSREGLGFAKPPPGAQINWGHPLALGLSGYWLFNSPIANGLGPKNLGLVGRTGGIQDVSALGQCRAHTATSDRTTLAATSLELLPLQGGTIALEYEKRDSTLRDSAAFGVSTATNNQRCGAHVPFTDGTVYFDWGGISENNTRESVAGLTTSGRHIWVFTSGPRGMEIWQDGILRTSNAANPTRVNAASAFQLGIHFSAASDFANYGWFYTNRRQLTSMECQRLSFEPYSFLLRQSPRVSYFPPAAAAGGWGQLIGGRRNSLIGRAA